MAENRAHREGLRCAVLLARTAQAEAYATETEECGEALAHPSIGPNIGPTGQ